MEKNSCHNILFIQKLLLESFDKYYYDLKCLCLCQKPLALSPHPVKVSSVFSSEAAYKKFSVIGLTRQGL
jgi:hypothetical protein